MKTLKKVKAFIDKILSKYDPIISKCNDDNVFAIAGQTAFFIILSAVPLLMFIISLLHNFNIPVELLEKALSAVLSKNMISQVIAILSDAYSNAVGISFVTLIITLWSAAQGIHSITNGLNRVYKTYENRNWFVLRIRAMLYTVIFFLFILAILLIVVLGTSINNLLSPYLTHLPDFISMIYNFRFIIVFLLLMLLFVIVFRNFPNLSREQRKKYKFKYQLPGAFLCTLAWFALSLGISIYVDDFNGFSIYGGLTRLAVIMIWIYFFMVSLMICAEINYVYHEQIKNFSLKKLINKYIIRKNKKTK